MVQQVLVLLPGEMNGAPPISLRLPMRHDTLRESLMPKRIAWLAAPLCSCICCVAGCAGATTGPDKQSQARQAIITQEQLPAGWTMSPTSEMPPSDKMPWWTTNPLVLEGREAKVLDEVGQPASASRVQAAMYQKDDKGLMICCLTYPTQEAVAWMRNHIEEGPSPIEERFVGFSRFSPNTLILISFDRECPDRSFFVNHFEAITCREQAPQSATTAK